MEAPLNALLKGICWEGAELPGLEVGQSGVGGDRALGNRGTPKTLLGLLVLLPVSGAAWVMTSPSTFLGVSPPESRLSWILSQRHCDDPGVIILLEDTAFPADSLGNPGMGEDSLGGGGGMILHSCMFSNNFFAAILC